MLWYTRIKTLKKNTKKTKRAKNVLSCNKSGGVTHHNAEEIFCLTWFLFPLCCPFHPSHTHSFSPLLQPKLSSVTLSHQNPPQTPKTCLIPQVPKAMTGVWPFFEGLGYFSLLVYFILSIWRWERFQGISLSAALMTWFLDAEFLIVLDSNNEEFEVSSEIQLCVFWKWSNCWISVSLAHL